MLEFYAIIIVGHLVADFLLQPKWLVEKKNNSILFLILHSLVHLVLTFLLFIVTEVENYGTVLTIVFLQHLIIDFIVIRLRKRSIPEFKLFIGDQIAHFSVLFLLTVFELEVYTSDFSAILLYFTIGIVGVTRFSSILIEKLMNYMVIVNPELKKILAEDLKYSGKFIGIIERLLIFIFVIINQPLGIGFLLTVKSWLRLKTGEDENKRIEYVLIGTLVSFFLAILFALFVRMVLVESEVI